MRAIVPATHAGIVVANRAQIYHEVRGDGPPVLMISGATGDAGHFSRAAELLAEEFTVVTFDRRGNSRSPAPAGWTTTSIHEQASDAAALIEALGLGPTAVFGNSGGAQIGLALIASRPDLVRGAIVHEPPLLQVTSDPEAVMAELKTVLESGMASGGPRGAMEAFIRVAGDETFETLEPILRERMLANAELFFGVEFEAMSTYMPDPDAITATGIEIEVATGVDNRGTHFHQAATWLAGRLGAPLREYPGGHAPYFDRPDELVAAMRPFLRRISGLDRSGGRYGTSSPAARK